MIRSSAVAALAIESGSCHSPPCAEAQGRQRQAEAGAEFLRL